MSYSIDAIFTLAAAMPRPLDNLHRISVPMHVAIVNADKENVAPNTTNPSAALEEADLTLDVHSSLIYYPEYSINIISPKGGRTVFTVAASFSGVVAGFEVYSGRETGGTNPNPTDVKISITQTSDPTLANVLIGSSDSLANFSTPANRSMAPVQLSPPTVNLPQDMPGYIHQDSVTVTLDFGKPQLIFLNPVIIPPGG